MLWRPVCSAALPARLPAHQLVTGQLENVTLSSLTHDFLPHTAAVNPQYDYL